MSTTKMGPRETARATGVSTDTLRHYERRGLLPGVHRTAAGHRRYSTEAVQRVLLIQRALVVGFSLSDLQQVLTRRDRGEAPCHSVRALLGEHLEALDRRIADLIALRDELRAVAGHWDRKLAVTAFGERAHLLDTLGSSTAIERTRRARNAAATKRA